MKKILSGIALILTALTTLGADINITNITKAATVAASDYVLGTTGLATRLLPVAGIAALGGGSATNIYTWYSNVNANGMSLTNATSIVATGVVSGSSFNGGLSVTGYNSGTGAGTNTFLRGDGTWVSPPTASTTNNVPVVVVSSRGIANGLSPVVNDGYPFGPDTPNTGTCGIQEAMNALPRSDTNTSWPGYGGGTVQLGPGIFYTTNCIQVPNATNGYHLTLQGPGMVAGGITYVGTNVSSAIKFGLGRSTANYGSSVYTIRDLWIASNNNSPTNIVFLDGIDGGIGAIDFDHVWFGLWYTMTNNNHYWDGVLGAYQPYIFTPCQVDVTDTNLHNLIGLDSNIQFDNWFWVRGCEFSYCQIGISFCSDHVTIENNYFSFCGDNGPWTGQVGSLLATNRWAWSDYVRIGANICLRPPRPNTGSVKAHSFRVYGNNHQWAHGNSPAILIPDITWTDPRWRTPYIFEKDGFETTSGIMAATVHNPVIFLNPTRYYDVNGETTNSIIDPSYILMSSRHILNTTDYSTWTNEVAGPELVAIHDMAHNYSQSKYSFSAVTGTNVFVRAPTNVMNGVPGYPTAQTNIALGPTPVGAFGYLGFIGSNYVSCLEANVLTNIAAAGAPYTRILTNSFTGSTNTGILTNCIAGYYNISWGMRINGVLASAGDVATAVVTIGGVDEEHLLNSIGPLGSIGVYHRMSCDGVVYLPAGTTVSLKLKNEGGVHDLMLSRAWLRIGTP